MKDPRTLEKVVSDQLIPWAAQSIYKSLNQAVIPHVVIVVNDEHFPNAQDEWDHHKSTEKYLTSLETPFENDPNLRSVVGALEPEVAPNIKTHADFLKNFYSSVIFVNIPRKAYLMRMDQQLATAYEVIKKRSSESYQRKDELGVLFKAERLERVFTAVFEHFSEEPDKPFNFLMDLLWQSHIPGDLDDNLFTFFRTFQGAVKPVESENLQHNAPQLFPLMTQILSSYIFLDSERNSNHVLSKSLRNYNYGPALRKAFEKFCETVLHCAFESKTGDARCCNVKANHGEKDHQGVDGKSLGKGNFRFAPKFDPSTFFEEWVNQIRKKLDNFQTELEEETKKTEEAALVEIAVKAHRRRLVEFLSNVDIASFLNIISVSVVCATACLST
ncbi:hypothetical protein QBC38DRAFT_228490 [Podospora fimiseda]|uniref:Uncharacterized protein n=1 Tax=Podospora fimiseda TaxID=252190 RepID=A0AAN7BNE8_9PEZI|nr:hypothetical protein QBC38DRAFT_228490 [Podospora fimiseda]